MPTGPVSGFDPPSPPNGGKPRSRSSPAAPAVEEAADCGRSATTATGAAVVCAAPSADVLAVKERADVAPAWRSARPIRPALSELPVRSPGRPGDRSAVAG